MDKNIYKKKFSIAMWGHRVNPAQGLGGVEVVVEELSTRMVQMGHKVTCYNRRGNSIQGTECNGEHLKEYKGVRLKSVFTLNRKGLAAATSSFFAAVCSAFGKYDVVHIHAEGQAFMCWIPKLFGEQITCTIHGDAVIISTKFNCLVISDG